MGYDDLCKSVIEKYRKAESENPDIGIREFANSIGEDFAVVWGILGFALIFVGKNITSTQRY